MKLLLTTVAALILLAAGYVGWYLLPTSKRFYTDADTIRQPLERARTRDILWQPPVKLAEIINSSSDDYEPRMSADGLTLFFVRGKAGEDADIYTARRATGGWTDLEPLAALNTEHEDLGPEPSADGQSIYFYSDRPGGLGGYDLWVSHLGTDGWRTPVNLGPMVNTGYNEYGPALTPDSGTLYFSSNRPRATDDRQPDGDAWSATVREDLFQRDYDLYSSSITDAGASKATAITELNTPYNEGRAAVSSFGDFLYFGSDRPGGEGGFDIYRSRRLGGVLQPAENLGDAVNGPANELDAGLSLGGYGLYFSSDREPQPGEHYDIYYTTSREVFVDAESHQRTIDWAARWALVGPNLLWALLALLLLLTLLALLRGVRDRRLSLLARCVLASLFAHLLMLLLFNFWQVTAGIAQAIQGKGAIRVALVSAADSGDINAQIRGSMTTVDAPATPVLTSDRPAPAVHVDATVAVLTVDRSVQEHRDQPEVDTQFADATPPPSQMQPVAHTPTTIENDAADVLLAAVALPNAPERVDAADPERADQTRPEQPRVTQRSSIDLAQFGRVEPADQVVFEPDAGDIANAVTAGETLAPTALTRDALPSAHNLPARGASTVEPLRRVAVNLADLEESRNAPVRDDASAKHASKNPAAVRGDVAVAAAKRDAASPLDELTPDNTAVTFDDTALLPETDHSITAAAPSPVILTSQTKAPLVPRAAIELSMLEEASAESVAEEVSAERIVAPSESPRFAQTPVAASGEDSPADGIVELTPDATMQDQRPIDTPSLAHDETSRDLPAFAAFTPSTRELPTLDLSRDEPQPDRQLRLTLPELHLPVEVTPPDNPYAQRAPERRKDLLESMGGSDDTERAVAAALAWLAEHQSADGRWDSKGFDEGCGRCDGPSEVDVDIALTGLSMLSFLGADHTHMKDGPYRDTVARAIDWLLQQQTSDGDLRGGETMYSHGIATIALAEALSITGDVRLRPVVERAAAFIEYARNRTVGGWRYEPRQPGDTSVLGWQVMALKSARLAGVAVSNRALEASRHWLDKVSTRRHRGLYAYQPNRKPTRTMTAEGMFVQLLLGSHPHSARNRESAANISQALPDWDSDANTYRWYYATLAMFQQQGPDWSRWNNALTTELLEHQRDKGRPTGSWDPADEWSEIGGRVYQTALCTLMLEVYYRYLPMYAGDRPDDAIGTIRGLVTDAETGELLPRAAIRVDLPDRRPETVSTGADGVYVLFVPEVPDHFAISVSLEGYIPAAADISADELEGTTLERDFELRPIRENVIPVEVVPDVHHLGNDRFTGRANSQFQRDSEGDEFTAEFQVALRNLSFDLGEARVWMLVKGVQCPHRIRINGTFVAELDNSPRDGSFGEFTAFIDPDALRDGPNVINIEAISCRGDLDDFEFINIQIHLSN